MTTASGPTCFLLEKINKLVSNLASQSGIISALIWMWWIANIGESPVGPLCHRWPLQPSPLSSEFQDKAV